MLRVLTLATLFPDASRPTFGNFVERQTLGLAARDGVELEVVAPIGIAPWPLSRHPRYRCFAAIPDQEVWKDTIIHRPRFTQFPVVGGRLAPAMLARALGPLLRTIHERFPFDIIDAEFFFPDGPAAMRIASAMAKPYSVKARGADINFWGHRPGCSRQIQQAGAQATGLLSVSEALKTEMVGLGMAEKTITVHRTGIDRDLFHPRDRSSAKAARGITAPMLVTVGALIERKGQQLAIEALRQVDDAELWVIGEGPYRQKLTTQAARLGLTNRVHFMGNLPHEEVAGYLAAADVMVLPSKSEGLANAWIEALASGTPVVICDAGGAREVVDRPEAGAIVADNADAFAAAINRLLARPPAQAAVTAAVDDYSWERNSETLFAHLSACVKG